jgi:hypothetical protein
MASTKTRAKQTLSGDELRPLEIDPFDALDDVDSPIVLSLSDLVRDDNGEVVLFNDSGLRALAVSTNAAVVAEGEAGRHVTAAGEDVSGFRYVAFDNGLKLFYQPGLDLILMQERTAAS